MRFLLSSLALTSAVDMPKVANAELVESNEDDYELGFRKAFSNKDITMSKTFGNIRYKNRYYRFTERVF